MSQCMEIAAQEHWSFSHSGAGGQKAIVLALPAGLPEVFFVPDAQPALIIQHVGIPFAPLARTPCDRHRRHMNEMSGWRFLYASKEPRLDSFRNECRMRTLQCLEAP